MNYKEIADFLFPNIKENISDLEKKYPVRVLSKEAEVTRFAPSPTGYMHIGGLYAALISNKIAVQSNGIFYLRIEDTDKKREIANGCKEIINSLRMFGIEFDEGPCDLDKKGYYPYIQSERKVIYQICVKYLISQGLAYPCFCQEKDIDDLRRHQERQKIDIGYYGEYAKCRNLTMEEIYNKINKGTPYVVRLKSSGVPNERRVFSDLIRGEFEMPENIYDIIILKQDGMPTYHFAHVVDDHFMRTTIVVRGTEWIPSWPIHKQLFGVLGFKEPKYLHIAPIAKLEGNAKRKLSKRKDPEAAVNYYYKMGIPVDSIKEYLLTICNSNFEEWRHVNNEAPLTDFFLSVKKMSTSEALFDMNKLKDISKNVIARMSVDECYSAILLWSKEYNQSIYEFAKNRKSKFMQTIELWKYSDGKTRKDVAMWADLDFIFDYVYLYNWSIKDVSIINNAYRDDCIQVISEFEKNYNENYNKDEWFNSIINIAVSMNYALNKKIYKDNADKYKGTISDFCNIIRFAITGKNTTPDLYQILKILGRDEVKRRLSDFKIRLNQLN